MHTSKCTSTIETAVYENRTYGGVRGRRLVTASYSIRKLRSYTIKTLREDRAAAEWNYVAYATRRRRRILREQDSIFTL